MKKARSIFSLILLISTVTLFVLEASPRKGLKASMIIGLCLINIVNGGVFYREDKKTNNLMINIVNFIAILSLIFWLL